VTAALDIAKIRFSAFMGKNSIRKIRPTRSQSCLGQMSGPG